jgi:hypothetical protein
MKAIVCKKYGSPDGLLRTKPVNLSHGEASAPLPFSLQSILKLKLSGSAAAAMWSL